MFNSMQADLFTADSLYKFRGSTTASRTGHNIGIVAVPILWPVPEAAVTVFSTRDDGCGGHPKHVVILQ